MTPSKSLVDEVRSGLSQEILSVIVQQIKIQKSDPAKLQYFRQFATLLNRALESDKGVPTEYKQKSSSIQSSSEQYVAAAASKQNVHILNHQSLPFSDQGAFPAPIHISNPSIFPRVQAFFAKKRASATLDSNSPSSKRRRSTEEIFECIPNSGLHSTHTSESSPPSQHEAQEKTRGGPRRRRFREGQVEHVETSQVPLPDTKPLSVDKEDRWNLSEFEKWENDEINVGSDGAFIIPFTKIYRKLRATSVEYNTERNMHRVSPEEAADITCILKDCGSPQAFRDLADTIRTLKNSRSSINMTESLPSSGSDIYNALIDRWNLLQSLTGINSKIAVRYHLVELSKEFEIACGDVRKNKSVVSNIYRHWIARMDKSVVYGSNEYVRMRKRLGSELKKGARWASILNKFGSFCLAIFPLDSSHATTTVTRLFHTWANGVFELLLEEMEIHHGEWLRTFPKDLLKYIMGHSEVRDPSRARLRLEDHIHTLISNPWSSMKYHAPDLLKSMEWSEVSSATLEPTSGPQKGKEDQESSG